MEDRGPLGLRLSSSVLGVAALMCMMQDSCLGADLEGLD